MSAIDTAEALRQFNDKVQRGICPRCGEPMTVQQNNGMIYAAPCEHLLWIESGMRLAKEGTNEQQAHPEEAGEGKADNQCAGVG